MARIGVNALYLIPGGVGGTEIYLRELLAALARIDTANEYFVFTNLETGADLVPSQANFHLKRQNVRASFRPARILWEQIVLPFQAWRWRLDVMFNPGFTAPVLAACPLVTVFHDLQHKRHPEHFRWFDLPFWRVLLWGSAHSSQSLITESESTRADLLRYYRLRRKPIDVIPLGVEKRFFELARTELEPYVLCVSTLHPHKNLDRLIRAYARGKREFRLVLAGMRGFHTRPLEKLIAELGLVDSVQLTGWIAREELYRLYERAHAFIYPSTFEGFGMPVLEALAAGIPTACSDIPVLREVAGDAALLFAPLDESAIGDALERVTTDSALRERLAEAGVARARGFTWEKTARATLGAITAVVTASQKSKVKSQKSKV